MNAPDVLMAAAEGGVIGDGRTGANLALGVGMVGVAIGWLTLARVAGRIRTGNARTGAMAAMTVGLAGTVCAVLHLATSSGGPGTGNGLVGAIAAIATSSGGPGTGNGLVGAIAAIPLGLIAIVLGRRALIRSRCTVPTG
ncbi:DUF6223 family protein [Streptomyces sp. NPDC051773]|uniref:DUF6223 family protein n=1 Tax=Streptomyces sp. NPDC051773 TaxID=3156682 RepID=UPI003421F27D